MMSSNVGHEGKYVYRFTFVQKSREPDTAESSKAEVQSYVNNALGVTKPKSPEAI